MKDFILWIASPFVILALLKTFYLLSFEIIAFIFPNATLEAIDFSSWLIGLFMVFVTVVALLNILTDE
ncbi:hypothetical protein [Halobacillus ihumii]|uniref:hypothetical protein n=1 Tax=Halobacillus ihumii TaxID=2686092 RepID=UPI0013D4C174|nr:hypothetical protein [Halobacillus ihumii]